MDYTLYTLSYSTVKKSHVRIDSNTNIKARIPMRSRSVVLLTPGRSDDVVSFLLAISARHLCTLAPRQKRLSGLFIGQVLSNKRGDVLGVVQVRAGPEGMIALDRKMRWSSG